MGGTALILWIAGVHILGLAAVAMLMYPALKENPTAPEHRPDDGDGGWGRGPRRPPEAPTPPRGGIPLPDARPARVRLREAGRLADRLPQRERRPVREPVRRPAPTPHRSGVASGRQRGA
jgi:hypothetical protein